MTKYFRRATLTYATQMTTLLLSFVINIVIIRMLGPSGKGVISLLQNYFLILVALFIFGMSEGNIYYLGNRRYKHRGVFSNAIFHTVVLSILFILLSIFLKKWLIEHFLKNLSEEYYLIALWIFPAFFLFLHITTILLGHKNIVGFNSVTVSRFFFILLFLLILIPKYGIKGALLATVIGFVVADIIGLSLLLRYGLPTISLNLSFLKDALTFGAKSQVGLMLSRVDRRLDIFIINLFLNPTQVGFYAVAVAMAELPWYISNALATVLFPEVSGLKKESAYKFTSRICRNTLFIVFLFSTFIFLFGGLLMKTIFGAQFLQSVMPLRLLIPGIIILSVNKVLCAGFSGTGKPEYGTYTAIFSAVVTISLDFVLIPALGINGAAIASSIAYAVSATTGIVLFRKISGFPFREFLLVTRKDIHKYPSLLVKLIKGVRNA